MASRAGISDSLFSEIFPAVEECYRAAFEQGLSRLSHTIDEATKRNEAWIDRVRSGLVALLGFFDDEPAWARLLVLDTPLGGTLTFECKRRLHELLSGLLGRSGDTGLTSELVVGGVFSVIRASLLEADGGKLVELAPSLMAFIVTPYLGQAAAQAELEGRASGAGEERATEPGLARAQAISRAGELPMRATRRTRLVLRAIAQAPYSNNREIARAAGVADEGQTSKLLARLERKGVIENVGVGAARGEPNAWLLTQAGRRAVELLGGESAGAGVTRPSSARTRGAA